MYHKSEFVWMSEAELFDQLLSLLGEFDHMWLYNQSSRTYCTVLTTSNVNDIGLFSVTLRGTGTCTDTSGDMD